MELKGSLVWVDGQQASVCSALVIPAPEEETDLLVGETEQTDQQMISAC